MVTVEEMRDMLARAGQEHLLKFWDDLNEQEQIHYLQQLQSINYQEANRLFSQAKNCFIEDVHKLNILIKPVPQSHFGSEEEESAEKLLQYKKLGLEEISKGKVAVLLLAGGQGTRLGVTYPKGLYSLGLPSGKCLLQIQAERLKCIQKLASEETGTCKSVMWYIMTSESTDEPTENYLKKFNYFGLEPSSVMLFSQGHLPCFSFDGKILLSNKCQVSLAPDGNGGMYKALKMNGILDDMLKKGIKYLHVYSVDNILVKIADPIFIGYCIEKNADCGEKVVKKVDPNEAVGVVCQVNGSFQVLEYSEITHDTANLRDSSGNLVYSAGNICNHLFTTNFLSKIAEQHESELKLHVAKKVMPYINDKGEKVYPLENNCIKIEKFIFDVFQFSEKFFVWEVSRQCEFSALKNTDKMEKDCPKTARHDLLSLHKFYIENAGGKVEGCEVEISPLLSYAGENLKEKVLGKTFKSPFHLKADEESLQ